MELRELHADSPQAEKDIMIDMLGRQMQHLETPRQQEQLRAALENALKPENRSHAFLFLNKEQEYVGMAFVNICSGIQSGGDYLWVNEVFISPEYRRKGYGSTMGDMILQWAIKHGCRTVTAITSPLNKASQTMVQKLGCDVSPTMWIEKKL